jgi:glycosyltransferase involved in cell wall biosynthesis
VRGAGRGDEASVSNGVVYINGRFYAQRITGVQRYAREMVAELDKMLAAGAGDGLVWKLVAPRGTVLPQFQRISCVHAGQLSGHAWEQLELPWIARDGLLVSFGATGPYFKSRQLVTVHDASVYRVPEAFSWRFRAWYRLVVRQVVRRAPRTLAVSHFAAREAVTYFGAAPHRVEVTLEGWQHISRVEADDSLLRKHDLTPGRYVLAVSSPTPNKNFAVVATAMSRLQNHPVRFVVAGAVDPRVLVSAKLGHDHRVTRVGYVSDAELRSLYANALCFVFPSKYEGFGIPPLEAMALGCPVVAAAIDSVREVCGDAARYFEPDDASSLERILRTLFESHSERAKLTESGLARAALFSWNESARRGLAAIRACSHRAS